VDFELDAEQVALRDELRRLLATSCSSESRRAAIAFPGGVDRGLWRTLSGVGVFALCQQESDGGVGLGMADATVVFEELGRALVPGPVIATFLAAGVIDGASTGTNVVGVVEGGERVVIEHLDGIDTLIVVDADGVRRVHARSTRGTVLERPLDPLTPVHLVESVAGGEPAGDAEVAARWRRDGALLVAAMQVGIGAGALEMAVEYAKQRRQFGRVIGFFQALKHLLADALAEVETARAAVQAAGVEIDEDAAASVVARAVAGARILASAAAEHTANTCIQVHGGMGFTWELDAHLFLKRSLLLDTQFGGVERSFEIMEAALA
jgi:alkylation response protein AidB-like acyl-CoA dehydrogenase